MSKSRFVPVFGWALRLSALIALIALNGFASNTIWQMTQHHKGVEPAAIGIAIRMLTYSCNLMAVWTAGSLFVNAGRGSAFVFSGVWRMGLWFLAGAAPILLTLTAMFAPALTHGVAIIAAGQDILDIGITTSILALIGLVLLVAAKHGKTLRSDLDQFV